MLMWRQGVQSARTRGRPSARYAGCLQVTGSEPEMSSIFTETLENDGGRGYKMTEGE